jgi:hypothetical protein
MKMEHRKEKVVKKPYLLNISNHPSSGWTGKQLETARRDYREIIDFPFPNVDPEFDEKEVHQLAESTVSKILDTLAERPGFDLENESLVAHIMGEMSLLYQMINLLESYNITCVCSTSKRISQELENGQKLVKFEFVRFRPYVVK